MTELPTTPTFTTENEFEAYLRGFTSDHYNHLAPHSAAVSQANVGKRDYLDNQIAKAASMAELLLADENAAHLAQALKYRQIPTARDGANPYLPIVRLLFGKWLNDNATERKHAIEGHIWKPDRSAEKYANILRYFKDESVKADDIPAEIAKTPGRLQAIERADRKRYAKKDPDLREVGEAVEELRSATPLASFPATKLKSKDAPLKGLIWFEVVDGTVNLMGLVKSNEAALAAIITREAKLRKDELLAARGKRLAAVQKASRQDVVDAALKLSKAQSETPADTAA